ncbi:hypothetical protein HYT54_04920 [Candidatus Woesearchaeota archaeon]|nr:hypothetical protein [Candidatus Woesearchaeota archaeon]
MKRSQAGIEYLMIIGFVTLITIPLIIIYFTSVQDTGDEINSRQALNIARKIADASESVYFLGEPSQTTIKAYIPPNVHNATLNGREVMYVVRTRYGLSELVQISSVNMTGSLPINQGIHSIALKAQSNGVTISYT